MNSGEKKYDFSKLILSPLIDENSGISNFLKPPNLQNDSADELAPQITAQTDEYYEKKRNENWEETDHITKQIGQLSKSVNDANEKIEGLKEDLVRQKKDFDKQRFDAIAVFSLFVTMFTYISIEINIFKNIEYISHMLVLSLFILIVLLIFILTLCNVLKDKKGWGCWVIPSIMMALLVGFLVYSLHIKDYLFSEAIQSKGKTAEMLYQIRMQTTPYHNFEYSALKEATIKDGIEMCNVYVEALDRKTNIRIWQRSLMKQSSTIKEDCDVTPMKIRDTKLVLTTKNGARYTLDLATLEIDQQN